MKRHLLPLLLCLVILAAGFVQYPAQDELTTILIDGNTRLTPDGSITVKLNDFSTRATVDKDGKAEVLIPKLLIGMIRIDVTHQKPYQPTANTWSSTFEMNGSGYVIYTLAADGEGVANQWPAVTWMGRRSNLDLYLNGSSKGSTQLTRGVEPERIHRFTWKRNNTVICDTSVRLPFNVKRTCICDEQSRTVTIQ